MGVSIFEQATVGTPTRRRAGRSQRTLDGRRPVATAWQPGNPGGRPRQPGRPTTTVVSRGQLRSTSPVGLPIAGRVQLTDRALTLLVVGFLLAMVLGGAVVIGQLIAIWDATEVVSQQVMAGAPLSQG